MSSYEIYPIPHNIRYLGEKLELKENIKVILDKDVDEVNKSKIKEIFSSKSIEISDDSDLELKIARNEDFQKFDQYSLIISSDNITIEYKNNDALFYALETLAIILYQFDNTIESLEIDDYADVKYRGIIEGFYGVPWSWKNKIELLKFGSKFKNNLFIYAPKDDPYHRDKWREQYPEKDLENLKIMAEYGRKYKNRFVYTIAPFKVQSEPITEENFNEAIEVLIKKLNQLYEIGIRQFGVLADDVGKLPHRVVVNVMRELSNWKQEKGDLYDFLFCPGSYVLTWAWDAEELNAYTDGFPEDVHIFFTGRETCTPVRKEDVDEYKTKEISEEFSGHNKVRRDPFFWLNWPVNDIDHDYKKLYMGKGEMLEKGVDNIVGLVTNPMQQANASKVAIFAVSDYSWNMEAFDCDKSWADSFKYIDKHAYEELRIISSHMANQDEKIRQGIVGLSESEDFIEIEKQFYNSIDNMLVSEFKSVVYELREKFEDLVKTVDKYFAKSKEEELVNEVKPFFYTFKELLLSGIYYIDAFLALEEGQKEIGQRLYNIAAMYYEKYNKHPIVSDPKTNRRMSILETSILRIKPIIKRLKEYMDRPFEKNRNISNAKKIFYRGLDDSKSYRIPTLLYTKDGTMLAFSDKRNEHQFDWGNIDLVVKRKEKIEREFGESHVIIDPVDQDGGKMPDYLIWPVDLDLGDKSAFVIDPVVLQDKEGTIFAFTTAFPESKGFFSIKEPGSGYIEKDGEKYLALYSKDNTIFYLKDNKILTIDGEETDFSVIIKKDENRRVGDILDKDGNHIGNIFLKNDKFFIQQTSHIIMTKSYDDGKTWTEPIDLNPQIKEEWMKFFGVAPGRGLTLENGRILVPTYFTNEYGRQSSCFIYSDDNGKTWHRGKSVNDGRNVNGEIIDDKTEFNYFYQAGESQAVELDNGEVKLFVRNSFNGRPVHIQIATSKDNGESFEDVLIDANIESQSNCQLSLVNTHYKEEEYVLMTAPSSAHSNERLDGKIYIGKVNDGNIDFYKSKIISHGLFWYSSLEEDKEANKFYILYEGGETLIHDHMDIMMREFTWDYLLEEDNL
ncbi:beta-N-acetylglucosaminidase domain-containing protein [Helcococcus kunzii]|uniref:beta-N-acetylglucosaminidase domain-containing protein n=1 Tax=Helcococcus kunzii TaxID=40091 RepID=UPI00389D30A5